MKSMIKAVPTEVYEKVLHSMKIACRSCQMQRADILFAMNVEREGPEHDRCADCQIDVARKKIAEQMVQQLGLNVEDLDKKEKPNGMSYQ